MFRFFAPQRIHVQFTYLVVNFSELPDQVHETVVLLKLLPGCLQGVFGDVAVVGAPLEFTRQQPCRMGGIIILGASACRFAAASFVH